MAISQGSVTRTYSNTIRHSNMNIQYLVTKIFYIRIWLGCKQRIYSTWWLIMIYQKFELRTGARIQPRSWERCIFLMLFGYFEIMSSKVLSSFQSLGELWCSNFENIKRYIRSKQMLVLFCKCICNESSEFGT